MPELKIISSFYKYIGIDDPVKFQQEHLVLCKSLNLKGRILLGEEGINGSVCGKKSDIEKYKSALKSNPLFSDMDFKEQETEKPAFRKMFVRVRKEIVHSQLEVDLKNTAPYITPEQLKQMLDKNEDFVLVDVRNNYESKIGQFKNAITLNINNFRDLPNSISEIKNLQNKKIVTYCTGGIRCEKASAFLMEKGFENVHQLMGGILKYGEEYPDTYWEGKCFVFDDRLAIEINEKNINPLTDCAWCNKKCDDYINCHNLDCDKLFICCNECMEKYNKSCCEECTNSTKRRKEFAMINS